MEQELTALLETLLRVIGDATYVPFLAPLVVILVALFKRLAMQIPGLEKIGANIWSFAFQVLLWVVYLVARRLDAGVQFESIVEALVLLLPAFFGSLWLTPRVYDAVRNVKVPVLGFTRSGEA